MSAMSAIRPGGGLVGAIGLALLIVLAASLSPSASAQIPQQGSCAPPFERGPGGQTISAGLIRVDLTEGYNYIWNAPSVGTLNGTLRICIIEYFSQVTIDTDTGAEISRTVAIPSAATVIDLIADSARLIIPPTPTPAPQAVLAGSGSSSGSGGANDAAFGTIRPPNTGEAGLR